MTIRYLSYSSTRSTTSLFESVSTLESDEVTCYSTFLSRGCRGSWHSIELYNMKCALWSLWSFQLSSLWMWSCDGKSTRIARPPSRMAAYQSYTVQPSQCHCTPSSAVPFAPFQSPLSFCPCTLLSGRGAHHTLLQAFWGQSIFRSVIFTFGYFCLGGMGGGSDAFVKVFVKGHALIQSGKWEGHDFFRKNF